MNKQVILWNLCRVLYLIIGVLFILLGFFIFPFIILGVIFLCIAYLTNKKYHSLLNPTEPVIEPVEVTEPVEVAKPVESPYIFYRFKVAGVTFKNGRKTRQAILRAFKWGDEELDYADFEPYEYEGRPAVYVKLNDQIIGNVPADKTLEFLEMENKYKRDNINVDIYGGSKLDDGSRTNYGCEIVVRYIKEDS